MPGWYGAPNVKYLAEIHVQEDACLGKYQQPVVKAPRRTETGVAPG